MAPSSRPITAGRCGWASLSATPGRGPSGWKGWGGAGTIGWASGNATATTTPPIRGKKSGTGSAPILDGRGAFGTLRGGTLRQPLEPDLGNASGGKHD